MKLATYERDGRPHLGAVVGDDLMALALDGVHDVGSLLAGPGLEAAAAALPSATRVGDWTQAKLLPPVVAPTRIVCVGANYHLHRKEMGRGDLPYPTLFVRWPSSLVGHGDAIERPAASERFDYEGELAVVIGRAGRHIAEAEALSHVAGYACFDDGSVRDYQRHTTQFTPGKNFDRSGAFGPYMVTADEVPDPQALDLETQVNGEVVQSSSTSAMTFGVAETIAYVSRFTTLSPGDVIATGTPSGVGDKREPPLYLKAGDHLQVAITQVGCLRVRVIDEAPPKS